MSPISKAYKNILANNEFIYLDIGARGGPQKRLKQLCNDEIIKIILVELEEKEAKKLEENYVVCNRPLWSISTKKKIYLTKNKSYSSLLKPNEKVLNGSYYFDRNFYEIEKIIETKTITLKELLNNNNKIINQIDFIKIDIQGAEGYLFKSFDKNIWNSLIGCETEAYTNELYKGAITVDKLISEFYDNNFEIYDLKNISSMTMTSFMNKKIFSENYFEARPKSRFYKGKNLVYDILFFRKIEKLIEKKETIKIRKLIFILMIYGYYDFAFFTILKAKHYNIFSSNDFDELNRNIKEIIKLSLPLFWRIKEKILLKNFKLKIKK